MPSHASIAGSFTADALDRARGSCSGWIVDYTEEILPPTIPPRCRSSLKRGFRQLGPQFRIELSAKPTLRALRKSLPLSRLSITNPASSSLLTVRVSWHAQPEFVCGSQRTDCCEVIPREYCWGRFNFATVHHSLESVFLSCECWCFGRRPHFPREKWGTFAAGRYYRT